MDLRLCFLAFPVTAGLSQLPLMTPSDFLEDFLVDPASVGAGADLFLDVAGAGAGAAPEYFGDEVNQQQ